MLKTIAIVTLLVQDVVWVSGSYIEHLDYERAGEGRVSAQLAEAWAAPVVEGQRYVLLEPASGAEVYLRFIEAPEGTPPVPALRTHGWNAAELMVRDPDTLVASLDGSPFRLIGPPADLTDDDDAPRAAQVLGPAGEVLYVTHIPEGSMGFNLGTARTRVDRVFIAVVGGPSMRGLRDFYGSTLGLPLSDNFSWSIPVLARAHSLPVDTPFSLAVAIMPKHFVIEMDEYPESAIPRRTLAGSLPGGMAMVSFVAEEPPPGGLRYRAEPRRIEDFPYGGRRAAVTVGPAGEWLELLLPAAASLSAPSTSSPPP